MPVDSDNPIKHSVDDSLQRRGGVESLAKDIREADVTEGYVVGIVGPWGSGKTSIVNMMREALQQEPALPVIDFNPWLFSGADELIDSFFRELSAQMRLRGDRLAELAKTIDDYSELLSPAEALPVIGAWLARARGATKALTTLQEKRKGSVAVQRDKLAAKLTDLEHPIVIVIDDIDRLESGEIRSIFKLVRLTASFPNVIYVLAFDRSRVEVALSQSGFDGRAYLEKIVQLGVEVPAVPESVMLRQIGEALDGALGSLDVPERFNETIWPDILMEIVRPLLTNMRDVKRYAAASRSKVRALRGDVELVDILALEAVRLFLPDVHRAIVEGRLGLTTNGGYNTQNEDPRLKQDVERVLEAGGSHRELTAQLIKRVFPAGNRHVENYSYAGGTWMDGWLRERRVAHPEILAVYLEQVASDNLKAFAMAERAFAVLGDEHALAELLDSYDLDKLQDVIAGLEAFEGDYPPESVVPATRVLLNLLSRLPERPQGMFSWGGPRMVVDRVVLRLLRQLESTDAVAAAVDAILPAVPSLSSRLELITLVGHREGAGHRLMAETESAALEQALLEQLRATSPDSLASEKELMRLLYSPKFFVDGEVVHVDPTDDRLIVALLLDARSTVTSASMGNRAVHRTTRLQWRPLVEIFRDEGQLRLAVDRVRERQDEGLEEVIALADRYLAGWRPSEWGDDG